jgi:hypothetical protein
VDGGGRGSSESGADGNFHACAKPASRHSGIRVNKAFQLPAASDQGYLAVNSGRLLASAQAGRNMVSEWRISTFNGALLAAYFIPAWVIVAFKIMISPIHGLYDRPNISVALFISDYLHLSGIGTVRMAWLLALGKLTVVAFLGVFLVLTTRASIRKTGGCDEALAFALAIGSVISFASMVMASQVGEVAALRLHAAELMLMLGTAILLLIEPPLHQQAAAERQVATVPGSGTSPDRN